MEDTTAFVGDNDHGDTLPPAGEEDRLRDDPLEGLNRIVASAGHLGLDGDFTKTITAAIREISNLRLRLFNIKMGFEGCCHACETVGHMNQELSQRIREKNAQIASIRARMSETQAEMDGFRSEVDEARRMFCELRAGIGLKMDGEGNLATPEQVANIVGWDCYRGNY